MTLKNTSLSAVLVLLSVLPAAAQPFVYRTSLLPTSEGTALSLHVTNVVNGSDTSIPIGTYRTGFSSVLAHTQVVVSPDNTTAWVTGADVYRVVLASQSVTAMGLGTSLAALALSPDGTQLYVADRGGARVLVVDTATGLTTGSAITLTHAPSRLAVSPDGSRLYALADASSQRLFVASTITRAVTLTITPTHFPTEMVLTPDGTRVLAAGDSFIREGSGPTPDNIVTAYDTTSGAQVSTLTLPDFSGTHGFLLYGGTVHQPAMNTAGTKLYVPRFRGGWRTSPTAFVRVEEVVVIAWPAMTVSTRVSVPTSSPTNSFGLGIAAVAGDGRLVLGGAGVAATMDTTSDAIAVAGAGVFEVSWVAAGGASAGAPAIVTHPASQTVDAGTTVTMTVAATSDAALSYQWQRSTDGGTTWANVPSNSGYTGMTTATLTLTSATVVAPARQYRVVVTNHLGTATSAAATVTVVPGGGWQAMAPGLASAGIASLVTTPGGTLVVATTAGEVYRQTGAGQVFTQSTLVRPYGTLSLKRRFFVSGDNEVFLAEKPLSPVEFAWTQFLRSRDGGASFVAWTGSETVANTGMPITHVFGSSDGVRGYVFLSNGGMVPSTLAHRITDLGDTQPSITAMTGDSFLIEGAVSVGTGVWVTRHSTLTPDPPDCVGPLVVWDMAEVAPTATTICPTGLPGRLSHLAAAANGQTFYGARQSGLNSFTIVRSMDRGQTWTVRGTVPDFVREIVTHPIDSNWVYAATNHGVYGSTDAGATWTRILPVDAQVADIVWRGTTMIVGTDGLGLWSLDVSPTLSATPSSLRFGARKSGASGPLTAVTPAQTVTVTSAGGSAAWTATADQSWLTITGGSGTGSGTLTVAVVDPSNLIGSSTSLTATITLTSTTPGVTSVTIPVTLTVDQSGVSTTAPFGVVDTPSHGATGLVGAIAMTGWALDDIGVQRVEVWRNCVGMDFVAGVCTSPRRDGGMSHVYIGQAAFLPGARPDVEQAYATLPQARRGGWGFLLLTNGLPHLPNNTPQGGQGTFVLSAFAFDQEGQLSLLGAKEVTVANDAADVPFGNLDTPAQGAILPEASFPFNEPAAYPVFGWAMTQSGKCIVTSDPTRYRVLVNGVPQSLVPGVNWFSGLSRPDLAAAFPGRCNSNDALAAYYLDLRPLGNGLHTLAWEVTDSAGKVAGIGSRFFEVLLPTTDAPLVGQGFSPATRANVGQGTTVGQGFSPATRTTVGQGTLVGQGFSPATTPLIAQVGTSDAAWTTLTPSADGVYDVRVPLQGRVVLDVGGAVSAAAEIVGDERRALPTGSTLEAGAGRFYWQPPVGFVGTYTLRFTTAQGEVTVRVTWYEPR
jgi:hypothetical protein